MKFPSLDNPFKKKEGLNPDTAEMVEKVLGKKAGDEFRALSSREKKSEIKTDEDIVLSEEQLDEMTHSARGEKTMADYWSHIAVCAHCARRINEYKENPLADTK